MSETGREEGSQGLRRQGSKRERIKGREGLKPRDSRRKNLAVRQGRNRRREAEEEEEDGWRTSGSEQHSRKMHNLAILLRLLLALVPMTLLGTMLALHHVVLHRGLWPTVSAVAAACRSLAPVGIIPIVAFDPWAHVSRRLSLIAGWVRAPESIRSSTGSPSVAIHIAAHVPAAATPTRPALQSRGRPFITVGSLRGGTSVRSVRCLHGAKLGVDVLGRGFQSPVRLLVIGHIVFSHVLQGNLTSRRTLRIELHPAENTARDCQKGCARLCREAAAFWVARSIALKTDSHTDRSSCTSTSSRRPFVFGQERRLTDSSSEKLWSSKWCR